MPKQKKVPSKGKPGLHPRNKNKDRYDFKKLIACSPDLGHFVRLNKYQDESIDFADAEAVKALNKAILKMQYGIIDWEIPQNYLCPPIPGRADYIHHIADLLVRANNGKIPQGDKIKCFDVGVGASCIYPIIGVTEYNWSFVASDIDPVAIDSSSKIIESNPILTKKVSLRLQNDSKEIFSDVIQENEQFDLTICNPPFHASEKEAIAGTIRKLSNLKNEKITKPKLNFGGINNELWCDGGEVKFVENMINQSKQIADSCFWFSTLISKKENLKSIYEALRKVNAVKVETLPIGHGNKVSRIVAWTFLDHKMQQEWKKDRW